MHFAEFSQLADKLTPIIKSLHPQVFHVLLLSTDNEKIFDCCVIENDLKAWQYPLILVNAEKPFVKGGFTNGEISPTLFV